MQLRSEPRLDYFGVERVLLFHDDPFAIALSPGHGAAASTIVRDPVGNV